MSAGYANPSLNRPQLPGIAILARAAAVFARPRSVTDVTEEVAKRVTMPRSRKLTTREPPFEISRVGGVPGSQTQCSFSYSKGTLRYANIPTAAITRVALTV